MTPDSRQISIATWALMSLLVLGVLAGLYTPVFAKPVPATVLRNELRLANEVVANSLPQVSAGKEHTCVINSTGRLTCWGSNSYKQVTAPSDLGTVNQVSAGGFHTCAVTTENVLRCWGSNSDRYGSISDQSTVPSNLGNVKFKILGLL